MCIIGNTELRTYVYVRTYVRTYVHASALERMIDLVTFQAGIDFGNGTTISLSHSGSSKVTRLRKETNIPADGKKPLRGLYVYKLGGGARRAQYQSSCKPGVVFHNYEHTCTCTFIQQQRN